MNLAPQQTADAALFDGPLEGELIAQDKASEARKSADPWGQARADRGQAEELQRMPLGGYLYD